jgi:hypothetical protein
MDNTRVKHSTLSPLKIFFERNNKITNTFSNLGNVFRNSKWSDLKIQNIKNSLVNQHIYLIISFILLVIIARFVVFQPTNLVFETLIYLSRTVLVLSQFIFFSLSLLLTLGFKLTYTFFFPNETNLIKSTLSKKYSTSFNLSNKDLTNNLNFTSNNVNNLSLWESNAPQFNYLHKVTNNLHNLEVSNPSLTENLNIYSLSSNFKNNHVVNSVVSSDRFKENFEGLNQFLKTEKNYIISSKHNPELSYTRYMTLTPSKLNSFFNLNPDLSTLLFNLSTPVKLAKQSR